MKAHRFCGLCSTAERTLPVENWGKFILILSVGFALPLSVLKKMFGRDWKPATCEFSML